MCNIASLVYLFHRSLQRNIQELRTKNRSESPHEGKPTSPTREFPLSRAPQPSDYGGAKISRSNFASFACTITTNNDKP
uniref:Uncharacterized protein n=1 Tax=Physcomitrium patens TaxID=3218 RepID=A0A2K1LAH8_PHYPA|nr:hypothetical protein PHYPA_001450 [Physcomitrium patens]